MNFFKSWIRFVMKAACLLFFYWVISLHSYCLSFTRYTTADGLSESTVNCIIQDSRGVIWIGTNDGLNSFNGYDFKVYRYDPDIPTSLSHNTVYSIYEDLEGNLWVCTEKSIDKFDLSTGQFEHFYIAYDLELEKYYISEHVSNISLGGAYPDGDGNFWVWRGDEWMFQHLDVAKRILKKVSLGEYAEPERGSRVLDVKLFRDELWVGTNNHGAYCINQATGKVFNFRNDPRDSNSLSNNNVQCVYQDSKMDIWLGTYGGGLCKYIPSDTTFQRINSSLGSSPLILNSNYINEIAEGFEGELMLGTDGGGINIINPSKERVQYVTHKDFQNASLSNNVILCIFQDRQGFIWVGNYQGGLNLSKDYLQKPFNAMPFGVGDSKGISDEKVAALLYDSFGNLWVGTDGGGLEIVRKGKKILNLAGQRMGQVVFDAQAVLALHEDQQGNIWVGTYLKGVYVFNKQFELIDHYSFDFGIEELKYNNDIRSIFEDMDGGIWIASNYGGAFRIDTKTKKFIQYSNNDINRSSNTLITNNFCTALAADGDYHVWIGTWSGLSKIDLRDNTILRYFHDEVTSEFDIESRINCIYIDEDGYLLLGTVRGLYKLMPQGDELKLIESFTVKNGLPSDNISSIEQDNRGNFWISTKNGLCFLEQGSNRIINYGFSDGLTSNDFLPRSSTKCPAGKLYFGSVNGFNWFDPLQIKKDTIQPIVSIVDFKLNNKTVPIGEMDDGRIILQKSILQTQEILLNYSDKVLGFDFVSIHYLAPEKNQLRYMLHGFDEDWIDAGNDVRFATYTNLSPGNYTFQVIGSNCDGAWNNKGASIDIVIKPPYWQTIWFRLLSILLLTSVLIGIYLYKIQQAKVKREELENVIQIRTHEIALKNKLLMEQADNLNQINKLLAERQDRIEEQTEELRSQKEQLEEVNKELTDLVETKDKFFSIIAHDLKNPFNAILGFSELLKLKYHKWTEEKKLRTINAIYDSTQVVFQLLENLLHWARAQQGRLPYVPERQTLENALASAIDLTSDSADAKNIQLHNEVKHLDLFLEFDVNMIQTVFRNLISNAIKFTPEGGKVTIGSEQKGKKLQISISDTGTGMPEEIRKKLFGMNRKIIRPGTNYEKGTGLGLILCKEFISAHNGRIWAESIVGKGSTFHFTLPLGQ